MAGIDLDVSAGPLEAMASLSVELGRMNDRADDAARAEKRRRDLLRTRTPIDVRLFSSGICPTPTANFGISLDGPDPGFYWHVRRIVVGGVTWATTAAGSAEIYITALTGLRGIAATGGVASIRSLTDLVDQTATLPYKQYYATHQLYVQPGENLIGVIVTGTAAQQYIMAAQVEVHRTIWTETESSA
jgi:hypothetical protein